MPKQRKAILIVEDEKPMARALELKLTKEGFDAQSVYDGEAAIEILQKQKFDFILLDLVMPKADGFKVLEAIGKMKIKTPVIVLSNLAQQEDTQKAKELGAQEFFVKSNVPLAEVVDYINGILKKP